MQPYAHDEAAISAPGLAKRAAWAGSIAAVRQMPTGPMLRCILLAAAAHAAHAFPTNDAERTAFTYLINGTEPADGLLEVDAAAAASAHVGMLANSGRIAPNDAALCADRARRYLPGSRRCASESSPPLVPPSTSRPPRRPACPRPWWTDFASTTEESHP